MSRIGKFHYSDVSVTLLIDPGIKWNSHFDILRCLLNVRCKVGDIFSMGHEVKMV